MRSLFAAAMILAHLLGWSSSQATAQEADTPPLSDRRVEQTDETRRFFSLGAAIGWQLRREFGSESRTSLSPELVFQGYLATPIDHLFLRLGTRLGYGVEQAESPSALTFEEHDLTAMVVASLLYEWFVVPAFSFGAGPLFRIVDLDAGSSVDASQSRIDRAAVLFAMFVQVSVGFPIENGAVVIEPFARYEIVPEDDRLSWRFGADATVGF